MANVEYTSMDAILPYANGQTKVDIPEWEPENNLDCPELIKAYERERSQEETSAGASASNSVRLGKNLNSVDITKLKVKVGVVVEWQGLKLPNS